MDFGNPSVTFLCDTLSTKRGPEAPEMGLQAIIFDVDGTVAETADLHRAAFNRAFQQHGLAWHWDREIYSQLFPVEFTLPKLRLFAAAMRRSSNAQGPSHATLAGIAALKAQIYCRLLQKHGAPLRPGVVRLLKEARHEGVLLAAVSTSSRTETRALLGATLGFQALSWFSSLKTAEHATVPAAGRALYQAVLQDFGIEGHRAVAIEDSASGANAAINSGIPVLITPSLYTASTRFTAAALTVSDLGQPAEPFTVISGDPHGHVYACPALLRKISAPKAAAA
jgi:beta-phosphoglucomutase-like phosphatase (HAD superfamily)